MTGAQLLDQLIDAIAERVVEKMGNTTVEMADAPQEKPTPEKKSKPKKQKAQSSLSLVDVRATLSEISRSGKQKEVKELITEFGGEKLTDLDPSVFEDLIKRAKEL